MIGSGLAFFFALPPAIHGMRHLGYPPYIIKFLGAAKVLGAVTILAGTFPRIKEWAYAGFTFNLLGAFYSHLGAGDGPKCLGPLMVLTFTIISYVLSKKLDRPREIPSPGGQASNSVGTGEHYPGQTAASSWPV